MFISSIRRSAISASGDPFHQGDLLPRHGLRHGPLDLLYESPSAGGLNHVVSIDIEDPIEHPACRFQLQNGQIGFAHEIIGGSGLGIDKNRLIERRL